MAMKKFGTKFVSLSFFDEDSEVFKAENGYNQATMDRAISFAAHCLLSKDVLVILDTKEVCNPIRVIIEPTADHSRIGDS